MIPNIRIDFNNPLYFDFLQSIVDLKKRDFIDQKLKSIDRISYRKFTLEFCRSGSYFPLEDNFYTYRVYFQYGIETVELSMYINSITSEAMPSDVIR